MKITLVQSLDAKMRRVVESERTEAVRAAVAEVSAVHEIFEVFACEAKSLAAAERGEFREKRTLGRVTLNANVAKEELGKIQGARS